MSDPFVDTDVLIRLLTGDDPQKQAAAVALFEQVEAGMLRVAAPDTVIADAVYVLASPRLYHLPRAEIRDLLTPLVRLPGLRVRNRRALLRALDLYARTRLDFGDAFIVATMWALRSSVIYSYDAHFDRLPNVTRRVPGVV
ncbi:MAG: PIN domain-containing protein [Chloroflexi bacterium]|nr:PIN domain-containing protein [Chloroflexota bacterium]MBI4506966.1 PIN domain-containing protein [Chloroflexota bacterium]